MADDRKVLELHFPACSDLLKPVRSLVCTVAQMYAFSSKEVDSLVLAVNEACMNIIQHAYGDSCEGEIVLEICDRHDHIVFRLTDFAECSDKCKIKPRDLADIRPGGLGVHLMKEAMDEVIFLDGPNKCGNVVELTKKINQKEGV